jgi:hypothetical protein
MCTTVCRQTPPANLPVRLDAGPRKCVGQNPRFIARIADSAVARRVFVGRGDEWLCRRPQKWAARAVRSSGTSRERRGGGTARAEGWGTGWSVRDGAREPDGCADSPALGVLRGRARLVARHRMHLMIVANVRYCWRLGRQFVQPKLACQATTVVACSQHRTRSLLAFRQILPVKQTPKDEGAGIWASSRCMNSNGFPTLVTTR